MLIYKPSLYLVHGIVYIKYSHEHIAQPWSYCIVQASWILSSLTIA